MGSGRLGSFSDAMAVGDSYSGYSGDPQSGGGAVTWLFSMGWNNRHRITCILNPRLHTRLNTEEYR